MACALATLMSADKKTLLLLLTGLNPRFTSWPLVVSVTFPFPPELFATAIGFTTDVPVICQLS